LINSFASTVFKSILYFLAKSLGSVSAIIHSFVDKGKFSKNFVIIAIFLVTSDIFPRAKISKRGPTY